MDSPKACNIDHDCPSNKYCYYASKLCVSYANCSVWNRAEAARPARDGSECGPCKPGYSTEVFTTGEERQTCIKNIMSQQDSDTIIQPILITIGVLVGFAVTLSLLYFLNCRFRKSSPNNKNCFKRCNTRNTKEEDECPNVITASAPPEEQDLFIGAGKGKYSESQNNNEKVLKDTNQYQTARAYYPPSWVRNANYGTDRVDFDSDDVNVPNENINALLYQVENHNPDNNIQPAPARLTIEISGNTEHQDNARNTDILQIYPFNNDSNADSTPELNENKRNKTKSSRNVIINQLLNHNITMNVNVINGED